MAATVSPLSVNPQPRLDHLGGILRRKFDQQVSARADIEDRWLEATLQYHGRYANAHDPALERNAANTSRIFVNLTRGRCRTLVARMSETLFPADDRNFEISPTPVPELAGAMDDPGAVEIEAFARERAKRMQRKIDDQLIEALYNEKARKAMHWAVMLGTGILKGPIVDARMERTWRPLDPVVYQLDTRLVRTPTVEVVSPWDFFPDMSATCIDDCEFFFERRYINKRKLRNLAKNPRYRADAIRAVLRENQRNNAMRDPRRQELKSYSGTGLQGWQDDQPYELIEYRGPLDRDDLEALGLMEDLPDPDDPLQSVEVVVEFIDVHIIRAEIHPLDTGDPLYSLFNLVEDDECIFGYGIPDIIKAPQIAVNAAWRMMLDNAAYSVGPQIAINRSTITGSDGDNKLRPRKIWYHDDPTQRLQDAMAVFPIQMHQPELMGLYMAAKQLIEEESQLPALMQGEMGQAPANTATGVSILSNAAGVLIREIIKAWDSRITETLIRRFYDFNMQYGTDPEIKGDFKIKARGSSALMVKETQMPNLLQLAGLSQQPGFAPIAKFPEIFRTLIETLRLSPEKLAKTDQELMMDQMQAQQQAGADPAAALAQQQAQQQAAQQAQQAESDREQKQLDYQMHAEELAADERMKAAELRDKQEQRAFEMAKAQSEAEQFQREAMLKASLGSGI